MGMEIFTSAKLQLLDHIEDTVLSMHAYWSNYIPQVCVKVLTYPCHNVCVGLANNSKIKGNIKAPHHWPLCGEFTGDHLIPRTNGQ